MSFLKSIFGFMVATEIKKDISNPTDSLIIDIAKTAVAVDVAETVTDTFFDESGEFEEDDFNSLLNNEE